MNRRAATARARELIRQRAAQKLCTLTIFENGDYLLKNGKNQFLVRMARPESNPEPEPGLVSPE